MFAPQPYIPWIGEGPDTSATLTDVPKVSPAAIDPNAREAAFVTFYQSPQGRRENPLGNDPYTPGVGKAEAGSAGTERVDQDLWGDQLYYTGALMEGSSVNYGGRGDRTGLPNWFPLPGGLPSERPARRFITFFGHLPYQGGYELRENVGGHVVVRRMPNAGQAQGAMNQWSQQVNQRRVMPPRWDAGAYVN